VRTLVQSSQQSATAAGTVVCPDKKGCSKLTF